MNSKAEDLNPLKISYKEFLKLDDSKLIKLNEKVRKKIFQPLLKSCADRSDGDWIIVIGGEEDNRPSEGVLKIVMGLLGRPAYLCDINAKYNPID